MRHVCFIGNSHLAAIKLGWDKIRSELAEVEATFFGAPGSLMTLLSERNGKLIAEDKELRAMIISTAANKHEIDIRAYDAVAVVGLGFSILPLIELSQTHRSEAQGWPAEAPYLVSENCLREAWAGLLMESSAAGIARRIAKLTTRPVVIVPQPMPSEAALDRAKWWVLKQIVTGGGEAEFAARYDRCSQMVANEAVTIKLQPVATLASPLLTRREYTEGAIRLRAGMTEAHKEKDVMHMNADYGAAVLRNFLGTHSRRTIENAAA